jgi:hypothetical protein
MEDEMQDARDRQICAALRVVFLLARVVAIVAIATEEEMMLKSPEERPRDDQGDETGYPAENRGNQPDHHDDRYGGAACRLGLRVRHHLEARFRPRSDIFHCSLVTAIEPAENTALRHQHTTP